ncbi:MAG: DUF1707 domain-containing protein [Solirubrobacterales bacterium]|nr:DUF1707 domain-containing protein [Solirubrobacterales bacterium]MBV9837041.1 DUF1707 domain-containing protein [Solirubrobacterales bacterium]
MSEDLPPAPSPQRELRASDEDRERLIDELHEHTVAGRLSTEELEQRLQQAYAARTITQLEELRRDLPDSSRASALSLRARRSHLTRRLVQETGGSLSLFVLGTAVWLVSGAHGQFWPVWILIVVLLSLARSAWALFGPAPDLEAVERRLDARSDRRERRLQRRRRR